MELCKEDSVVNDLVEHGISLIEQQNNCLNKNEEQLHYIFQVVQNDHCLFPDCHIFQGRLCGIN